MARSHSLASRLALAAVAITVAGCASAGTPTGAPSGSPAGTANLPVVRFQGLPNDPAGIPLLVMQQKGIDAKYGFKAEYVEVDPDAATNTFLIGESEIAMEQDAVNMTLAQAEGHDAVVFYPVLNTMMSVVVMKDSAYQTPADLVGKKVGQFGVDSGTTSVIALMIKEIYGIDVFKQYDLREAGPAALPELLKSGEVQAIFDYEPLALRAVMQGPGRYVFEPAKAWAAKWEGWSPPLTNLAARVDWLKQNKDLAIKVRDAWAESVKVISDGKYAIFGEEPYKTFLAMASDEELQAFITYCAGLPCYLNSWGQKDVQKTSDWLALMAKNSVLIKAAPANPVAVVLEDFQAK